MRRYFLLQLLAPLCFALQKKGKSPKPPEVLILKVSCYRAEGDVLLDGSVRVQADRPVRKLHLLVDFFATGKQPLSSKRGEISEVEMRAGDESEFHLRVSDPVRAVSFALRAEDHDGRELSVENAGPFPIE